MIVWSRGKNKEQLEDCEEKEMDTSGMQTQNTYSMPPPVVKKSLNQ